MSDWCFFACGCLACFAFVIFAGKFLLGEVGNNSPWKPMNLDKISTPKRTSMYSRFADVCFTLKIHDTSGQICAKSMDCWGILASERKGSTAVHSMETSEKVH